MSMGGGGGWGDCKKLSLDILVSSVLVAYLYGRKMLCSLLVTTKNSNSNTGDKTDLFILLSKLPPTSRLHGVVLSALEERY